MEQNNIAWYQNVFTKFPFNWELFKCFFKPLCHLNVYFEWYKHLVVYRCIQSFKQVVYFFFMLKTLVSWYICETDYNAFFIIEIQIHAADNDSLWAYLLIYLLRHVFGCEHKIGFKMIWTFLFLFASVPILCLPNDLVKRYKIWAI